MSTRSDRETLRVLLNHLPGGVERQYRVADTLDGKLTNVMVGGSVALGFVGLSGLRGAGIAQTVLIALAAAAWLALAGLCIRGLWTRGYQGAGKADAAWGALWDQPPEVAMHSLVEEAAEAYAHNAPLNAGKARQLRFALVALAAELVVIAGAFLAAALGA